MDHAFLQQLLPLAPLDKSLLSMDVLHKALVRVAMLSTLPLTLVLLRSQQELRLVAKTALTFLALSTVA